MGGLAFIAFSLLVTKAAGISKKRPQDQVAFIPRTEVPMPPDYEDYSRGHEPWRLFPDGPPGERVSSLLPPGLGLPIFIAEGNLRTPEVFMEASAADILGHMCAPGGEAAGHYFYNTWDPELVPFLADPSHPDFANVSVIVAPGGGEVHLAWEPEGLAQAGWLNSIGISAFVLKYRVPDVTQLLSLMDAQRAVALVRAKAAGLGLRPDRVGFLGESAGGALAIRVGAEAALAYPPVDEVDSQPTRPDFLLALYPGIPAMASTPGSLKHMPPIFLGFAQDDPCSGAHDTRDFLANLNRTTSAPVRVVEYAEGGHGWSSCDYYPMLKGLPNCDWHSHAEAFIRHTVLGL
eukprot:CAMPEP_0171192074 /NCGR_PEP_ID=MMETSP0790-20130122/19686_1 /TAXON_ID=2925 /ORGANISM="Alexandrium catenella, Strain OF101" /LENGTH=346 /DNA_ID=CAMNT_0011657229 /DNA_START=28 /DNA_END=1068 /DNA_ORIENTATION=-